MTGTLRETRDDEAQDTVQRVRGVVRIDIDARKQTHGWQARRYFGRSAQTQFFSDSKYGGREGSHAAAAAALRRMERGG